MEMVERLCLLERLRDSPNPDQRSLRTISVDDVDVQRMTALAMSQFSKYREREGIFTSTEESVMDSPKTMAPATWWATYGKHLALILEIAQTVRAQPVSASAAERN
eukprot:6187876-Pleurochrysis_carterae.AAC.1